MSGSTEVEREQPEEGATEQARESLEQAETGDTDGIDELDNARTVDSAGVDAAEQEASDGPEGLGLAR